MSIQSQFVAAINDRPRDMDLRMVYADWLEERGDEYAFAWRWLVENFRTPLNWGETGAIWWCTMESTRSVHAHELPEEMFIRLGSWNAVNSSDVSKEFSSPFAALEAAATAVETIRRNSEKVDE